MTEISWTANVDVRRLLTSDVLFSTVLTRCGPHLTPTAFSASAGRLWVVTPRASVKARALRTEGPACVSASRSGYRMEDKRGVLLRGQGTARAIGGARARVELTPQTLTTWHGRHTASVTIPPS